jgi:hypothetical protein
VGCPCLAKCGAIPPLTKTIRWPLEILTPPTLSCMLQDPTQTITNNHPKKYQLAVNTETKSVTTNIRPTGEVFLHNFVLSKW